MTQTITVMPGRLGTRCEALKDQVGLASDAMDSLEQTMDALPAHWEGEAASTLQDRFAADRQRVRQDLAQLKAAQAAAAQALAAYQRCEQQIRQWIAGLKG